jgi:hypothetical protein
MATTTRKMIPSRSGGVPFATGVAIPLPIAKKIDRNLTAWLVQYGLKGRLRLSMILENEMWTFTVENTETDKTLIKPTTNRSIAGMNKLLSDGARASAKTYQELTAKQKKTA